MKICSSCKIEKDIACYGKLKSSKDGLRYDCKTCRSNYRIINKDTIKKQQQLYYENNKSDLLEKNRQYREINAEKINIQRKEYRNRSVIKEHIKIKNKEYLETRKENLRKQRQTDLNFRLREILRSKFHRAVKKIGYSNFLGCSIDFFKRWIEFKFTNDMNWDNIGVVWHIDHILPISKFNLRDSTEINICFNWTNLQPLYATENISKSNKISLHHYFNNLISVFRFNKVHKQFMGYQNVNESLHWLRKNYSGMVKSPRMTSLEITNEMDNPQPSS